MSFGNVRWAFVFVLFSSGFHPGKLPRMLFLHLICQIRNTEHKASEACIALDVVLGSFGTSCMNRCTLEVILVRFGLGWFIPLPCFLSLWMMGLSGVCWSPKALQLKMKPSHTVSCQ
ncbi:hypothetical protein AMECASPLE_018207 [Ameca splendens]|uniref:Secreted protein n=1 Tax=Ameca splendens TaxID=208324 RepID=A0ABV0ZZM7_9TELE